MSILKRFGIDTDRPSPAGLFVLVSVAAFLVWFTSPAPATVPADHRYYDMYASMYPMLPVMGFGTLFIGLLLDLTPAFGGAE
ncbi:hypothetical protein CP556_24845 [Natrinema sp. CBA1119]|uniref:hypothetical protein n=1 Tax=Natrinema sp. CBA1119 TaxID=1608465 RepID=UPI000BF892CC|nr:hypothetical protein [Natrinema sp. CBA1119]PGF14237.1 hypothetical protein CP556_24845 [Natrinema sp. CBA1119]